jgi:1,4-dihydroxy-2-naphthoyl-CoA hydrolase
MIWKNQYTLEQINAWNKGTLGASIGLEMIEIGPDFLKATMPVDDRTVQPFGLLHGGASVALAETLGSVASTMCINTNTKQAVGLEINANHLKGVKHGGMVTGTVTPIRIGKSFHVWHIEIHDGQGKQVCVSRLTCAVIEKVLVPTF